MSEWSKWERTPWLLRLFGKPAFRRYMEYAHVGGCFIEWEYSEQEPRP